MYQWKRWQKRGLMKPSKAHRLVRKAIADKNLIRPKVCELCDDTEIIAWSISPLFSHLLPYKRDFIVSHHWKGYDFPLDVWFICHSCNTLLRGYHSGNVSKEQIRDIFSFYVPTSKAARITNTNNDVVNGRIKNGNYPGAQKLSSLLSINIGLKNDPWMIPKHLITGTNQ